MKKIFAIQKMLLAFVFILLLASCKKSILDFSDPNSYNSANYFNTPDEIRKGTNAIYVTFNHNKMMCFEWPEMFDVLANEAEPTLAAIANEPSVSALWQYQYVNTNATIERFWKMLYKMILRSNLVIDKSAAYIAKNGNDNQKIVSMSAGEAHFLRGYAYSQLAFYWGRVPIRTAFDQSGNINAARAATAEAVWLVAENDFKTAQSLLPEAWDAVNVGRATRGAATGFLGKLYLYNKKYAEADVQFESLKKYDLLPGAQWSDNFGETNKNNGESLFEVQFQWFDGNATFAPLDNPEGSNNLPATQTARQQLYGWNDWGNWFFPKRRVDDFIYEDETAKTYIDPRAKLTFYGGIGAMTWLNNSPDGPLPYLFDSIGYWYKKNLNKEYKKTEQTLRTSNNLRLLRFADILLMRAECKLNTGAVPAAIGFINQVRNRIGAFPYQNSYSQVQAFELLKRERQLEFMGEQSRFNDLKRWGILKDVMNIETQAIFGAPRVLDKHSLFPIPLGEIDSNVGLGAVANQWN